MKYIRIRNIALLGLALLTSAAQAHTGHSTTSLMEGLIHPFGVDHLLVMIAVGVWSVRALPQGKAWWGPATFLTTLIISAALGALGLSIPYLEHSISLSVILLGVMLCFAHRVLPTMIGLGLIALTSSLHGLAHGAETVATDFVGYAFGFMLTTSLLHVSGMSFGLAVQRWFAQRSHLTMASLGAVLSVIGVYLFGQLA